MEGYAPIGKVCPVHRGEYRADETYRINDIVTYQKSTYWHKAELPTRGVLPTDETVWQVLVPYQEMVKRTNYQETDPTAAGYLEGKQALDRKIDGKLSKSGGKMEGALTVKGIMLTAGVDYFEEMPGQVTAGQLIFVRAKK